MGFQSILSVIQPVTIDTMLNKNGPFLYNGLKNVKCEQALIDVSIFVRFIWNL